MAKVVEVYPDKSGIVRNVQVLVKPNQDGSSKYKPSQGYELKRHVSKLMLLVPAEEEEKKVEKDENVEVNIVIVFSRRGSEERTDALDPDSDETFQKLPGGTSSKSVK